MKNVIAINTKTDSWLSIDAVDDGTNSIYADVLLCDATNPQLKVFTNGVLIYSEDLDVNSDNLVNISGYIPSDTGSLAFQYVDSDTTGSTYTINFNADRSGDLNVSNVDSVTFTALYYDSEDYDSRITSVETGLDEVADQLVTFDDATKNMEALISMGFGMYTSSIEQPDGSYINYMHDAETLAESSVIWKLTSSGLMVTTDAGTTWGVDSLGNALFNVITVHGLNADWINSGTILSRLIASNAITSDKIAGKAVTADKLYADLVTAETFNAKILEIQNELDGSIEIIYTDHEPTLNNYPATEWCVPIYPAEDLYPSNTLIHIYTDEEYEKHQRTLVFDTATSITYRFEKNNSGDWVFTVLQNTDYSVILGKINELTIDNEQLNSQFTAYEADLEDNYYTITETNSAITQNANSVLASVGANYATKASLELAVDTDTLVGKINATADIINIKSTEFVLNANNCSITADGTATFNNGIFNGTVNANVGNIGGWVLNNNYLHGSKTSGGVTYTVDLYSGINGSAGQYSNAVLICKAGSTVKALIRQDGLIYGADIMCTDLQVGDSAGGTTGEFTCTGKARFYNTVYFYTTAYTSSGAVVTSDKNAKHDISSLDIEESSKFIYSLDPVEYKYNDGDSGRLHHGLIAQDVKESMGSKDWGVYTDQANGIEDPILDEDGNVKPTKGLRYEELIADLIATVQSQNKRITELERRLKDGN